MSFMSIITGVLTVAAVTMVGLVSGCAAPGIDHYKNKKPVFDVREYLNGKIVAFGTITDYTGEITDRFRADIVGEWTKTGGTLTEKFTFDDGHKEERVWTFTMNEDGSFRGKAHDIVGEAVGRQSGNAVFMNYTLARKINGRMLHFSMDDRLYLIDDTYLINVTKMKKFGITVATLNLGFHKVSK